MTPEYDALVFRLRELIAEMDAECLARLNRCEWLKVDGTVCGRCGSMYVMSSSALVMLTALDRIAREDGFGTGDYARGVIENLGRFPEPAGTRH